MEEVLCYNRGCGQSYVPDEEDHEIELKEGEGPCLHHPGAPFFHDAYKGWTCCNKKATDFTEFLNFKGCTRGRHCHVKPVEPEHITGNLEEVEMPEVREPISSTAQPKIRPSFDLELTIVVPKVAQLLRDQMALIVENMKSNRTKAANSDDQDAIKVGEGCKNPGCKKENQNADSNLETCIFHPGAPIFHEGMKYWSCCQKKTSDFTSFLNQVGCQEGTHCWIKKEDGLENTVKCRYDWHQTGNNVTMSIYCKKYDPDSSYVKINPVRLKAHIVFPEEGGNFDLDIELGGVIDCKNTKVSMMGTKVEVTMAKADLGSWSKLNLSRKEDCKKAKPNKTPIEMETANPQSLEKVDALNLDDLELSGGGK